MSDLSLAYPYSEDTIRSLHVGDRVRLSGLVYTGRDRLHKFLGEGNPSPVPLHNAAIFHCGPVILRQDNAWHIVAAGPTTSIREEPYMPTIIRQHGLRIILGKGGLGPQTLAACADYGCVYLQAVGGAAALIAQHVRSVDNVYLLDRFGPTEAMWALQCDNLEAIVGMDSHGQSLYHNVQSASAQRLHALLASVDTAPNLE